MARGSFLLFLILSSPLGLHHQVTDPGIHEGWKLFQAFLTFAVFFPSLLTFLNVVASLEGAGRARGKGCCVVCAAAVGDPSLAAQLLAMLTFCAGGIGGLINASYNMNLVAQHRLRGGPLPHHGGHRGHPHPWGSATGWSRTSRPGAVESLHGAAQAWMWFVGMLIFHLAARARARGMPRRTMISQASYFQPDWSALLPWVGGRHPSSSAVPCIC
jgi:cytochrome c oxidase subunit 1